MTKDDIDAVSLRLHVNGALTFSTLLTRGGLTQRMGWSDQPDPRAVPVKGRTDHCFEDFMAAMPESVLTGGGHFEDEGRVGARHEWTFELGGGMESLTWTIAYHQGSASLPDEFADMVVQAERLTHAWYLAGVAEVTGAPLPAPSAPATPATRTAPDAAPERSRRSPPRSRPGTSSPARGQRVPLTRERLVLVVLVDLIALTIPWSFLQWVFGAGGGDRTGPPGAGLVLFAIAEFVLLQIARRSPGYWLLGVTAELGRKPQVDAAITTRESELTLATGIGLLAAGVAGLTSWAAYHTPAPYFGLGFPIWLSLPLTVLLGVALTLAGVLVLRHDLRGVWIGGGVALFLLLSGLAGWAEWGPFVDAVVAERSEQVGRPVGEGLVGGLARDATPFLLVLVPAALAAGAAATWRRFSRPAIGSVGAASAATTAR